MPLSVAIQMDPVESIHPHHDTTYLLALEAQQRGYELFYYQPKDLALTGDRLTATGYPIRFREEPEDYFRLGEQETRDLLEVDVVLMRQDPPFNMAYITATHLLEHIHPDTLVINDPAAVRNAPEKLLPLEFPSLTPPTLVTRNLEAIHQFRQEHEDIVIKPLYRHGGESVFHIHPQDRNFPSIVGMMLKNYEEPLILQKFLPGVHKGCKRVLIIDGEVIGAMRQTPLDREFRSNLTYGSSLEPVILTPHEEGLCHQVGHLLSERKIFVAGLDLIDGYLLEVNITSPGFRHIVDKQKENVAIEKVFWDKVEAKFSVAPFKPAANG